MVTQSLRDLAHKGRILKEELEQHPQPRQQRVCDSHDEIENRAEPRNVQQLAASSPVFATVAHQRRRPAVPAPWPVDIQVRVATFQRKRRCEALLKNVSLIDMSGLEQAAVLGIGRAAAGTSQATPASSSTFNRAGGGA